MRAHLPTNLHAQSLSCPLDGIVQERGVIHSLRKPDESPKAKKSTDMGSTKPSRHTVYRLPGDFRHVRFWVVFPRGSLPGQAFSIADSGSAPAALYYAEMKSGRGCLMGSRRIMQRGISILSSEIYAQCSHASLSMLSIASSSLSPCLDK